MNKKTAKLLLSACVYATTHIHALDINIATGELYTSSPTKNIHELTGQFLKPLLIAAPTTTVIEKIAQSLLNDTEYCIKKPRNWISAQIGFRADSIQSKSRGTCEPQFIGADITLCSKETFHALPCMGNFIVYSNHCMFSAQGEYAPILGGHRGRRIVVTNSFPEVSRLSKPQGHCADALVAFGPYWQFGPHGRSIISPHIGFNYDQQYIKHAYGSPQKTTHTWFGPMLGFKLTMQHRCWSLGMNYYYTFAHYHQKFTRAQERLCSISKHAHGQRLEFDFTGNITNRVDLNCSLLTYIYQADAGQGNFKSGSYTFTQLCKKQRAHWKGLQLLCGIGYSF